MTKPINMKLSKQDIQTVLDWAEVYFIGDDPGEAPDYEIRLRDRFVDAEKRWSERNA